MPVSVVTLSSVRKPGAKKFGVAGMGEGDAFVLSTCVLSLLFSSSAAASFLFMSSSSDVRASEDALRAARGTAAALVTSRHVRSTGVVRPCS